MTGFFLRVAPAFLLIIRGVLFALTCLFFIALLGQFNSQMAKNRQLNLLLHIEQVVSRPINPIIRSVVPRINGFDATNLSKLLLSLFLSSWLRGLNGRVLSYRHYLQEKEKLERWRKEEQIDDTNSLYLELEKKLEQINTTKDKALAQKLHLEFMELKKKLESKSRFLAFLSIDVVNSTGMKNQEDKSMIQLDFLRFKRLIQKLLDKYGCVKSAWTPDGVMVCFDTVESAVSAAKESLFALKRFNSEKKQISHDFAIRCGIHAGHIYYDEKLPLEEITDQVIDIAGHMQKHAEPGTIAISKLSIKPVDNPIGFKDLGKKVDELEVCTWGLE
ncbi:hypothetical protein [Legionella sp. CNM-4043-24]|uniref:hypothetical protein n=1 Tax=Legionella sp. CNM-4043-24 TaxID=3421646 RepID=UPI00403B2AF3